MSPFLSQATSSGKVRKEYDTFGELEVPADRYYGAQTARSKMNFPIGDETERMPVRKTDAVNKRPSFDIPSDITVSP